MGRLDRQKGVDRLARLVERQDWSEMGVQFRVVGKSILEGAGFTSVGGVAVEPPAYDADALIELLSWADVLLLPSRFEGLPLGVIEALTAGVVPIVTECGAVREVVDHGSNGFIVSQQHCVAEMSSCLAELARDPAKTLAMAGAAIGSMADRHWHGATEEFYQRLCKAIANRRESGKGTEVRLHSEVETAQLAE
jgi:glycosyltransferase involved in cell wall biosynthesis